MNANRANKIDGFIVNIEQMTTNIIFVNVDKNIDVKVLANELESENILISPSHTIRLVIHLDINISAIDFYNLPVSSLSC